MIKHYQNSYLFLYNNTIGYNVICCSILLKEKHCDTHWEEECIGKVFDDCSNQCTEREKGKTFNIITSLWSLLHYHYNYLFLKNIPMGKEKGRSPQKSVLGHLQRFVRNWSSQSIDYYSLRFYELLVFMKNSDLVKIRVALVCWQCFILFADHWFKSYFQKPIFAAGDTLTIPLGKSSTSRHETTLIPMAFFPGVAPPWLAGVPRKHSAWKNRSRNIF